MLKNFICLTLISLLLNQPTAHGSSLTEVLAECLVTCSNNLGEVTPRRTSASNAVVARGKAGPRGHKGEKGEIGSCEADFAERFEILEKKMKELLEKESHANEIVARLSEAIHASDCAAYRRHRSSLPSGVYSLYPYENFAALLTVYCQFDEANDGDHWTVFQRRFDGSVNFNRESSEYIEGFGEKSGEYWLGLKTLNRMTSVGTWEMRIDLEDFDNNRRFARYSNFTVGVAPYYRLGLGVYSGNAGDSLRYQEGHSFSTSDRDQDEIDSTNCALNFLGGWWFANVSCFSANLNGKFHTEQQTTRDWQGINWNAINNGYSLKSVTMSFRKI